MERFILYGVLTVGGYFIIYLILKAKLNKSVDPKAILESIREEVDRIIVELNSTTDRNITLLEDRVQGLSTLLEQADKKIGMLRREIEKHELSGKVYSELARGGKSVQEPEEQDRHAQVLNLHREGISPSAIAKRLGITLAEIELIITLASQAKADGRE